MVVALLYFWTFAWSHVIIASTVRVMFDHKVEGVLTSYPAYEVSVPETPDIAYVEVVYNEPLQSTNTYRTLTTNNISTVEITGLDKPYPTAPSVRIAGPMNICQNGRCMKLVPSTRTFIIRMPISILLASMLSAISTAAVFYLWHVIRSNAAPAKHICEVDKIDCSGMSTCDNSNRGESVDTLPSILTDRVQRDAENPKNAESFMVAIHGKTISWEDTAFVSQRRFIESREDPYTYTQEDDSAKLDHVESDASIFEHATRSTIMEDRDYAIHDPSTALAFSGNIPGSMVMSEFLQSLNFSASVNEGLLDHSANDKTPHAWLPDSCTVRCSRCDYKFLGSLANGVPTGNGVAYFSSGVVELRAIGLFHNGLPKGHCIIEDKAGHLKITGTFCNGVMSGSECIIINQSYEMIDLFEQKYKGYVPHTLVVYQGGIINGKPEGLILCGLGTFGVGHYLDLIERSSIMSMSSICGFELCGERAQQADLEDSDAGQESQTPQLHFTPILPRQEVYSDVEDSTAEPATLVRMENSSETSDSKTPVPCGKLSDQTNHPSNMNEHGKDVRSTSCNSDTKQYEREIMGHTNFDNINSAIDISKISNVFPALLLYLGNYVNGTLQGRTLVQLNTSILVFAGMVVDGLPHGKIDLFAVAYDMHYSGNAVEGDLAGHGKLFDSNTLETLYDGLWDDGKASGNGLAKVCNNALYDGEFKDGMAHGKGVLTVMLTKIEVVITGSWQRGRLTTGFYDNRIDDRAGTPTALLDGSNGITTPLVKSALGALENICLELPNPSHLFPSFPDTQLTQFAKLPVHTHLNFNISQPPCC